MLSRRQFAGWCALLGTMLEGGGPANAGEGAPAPRHRFLALDAWGGRLWHVDQFDPARDWNMALGGLVRDMQLIGEQRLLVPGQEGFWVYDLDRKAVVEQIQRAELNGSQTARHLDDGTTLLGANQKEGVAILVLDPAHRLMRKIVFPQFNKLRLLRRTAQGTLLLCEYDGCSEVNIDEGVPDDRRVVRRFPLPRPRNAFMAERQPDGKTLVSGGYAAGLFEYGADGKLVRELAARQPAGMGNWFYAGFQVLKNGNIVQANWNGHNPKDYHPGWKLFEFDGAGKVVWNWAAPEKVGAINNVIVLDD